MIKATHYVVDLETLATSERAAIATIGVVRVEGGRIQGEFYARANLANPVSQGRVIDLPTIAWWLDQSDEARAEIARADSEPLPLVLERLREFMGYNASSGPDRTILVWGNGAGFDCNILRSAYQHCMLKEPWPFQNDRDLRTILDLYPEAKAIAGEFEGIRHHALHDARHEARRLIAALNLHAKQLVAP